MYQQAIKRDPDNIALRMAVADALVADDHTYAAKGELEQVLKRNPDYVPALLRIGEILTHIEEGWAKVDARRYLERALNLQPDNVPVKLALAEFHRDQAEAHYSRDHWVEAIENYQKALEYQPDHATTLAAMANSYILNGDEPRAQQTIEKAIQRAPRDLDVVDEILSGWIKVGQMEQAWQLLEQAEARIPSIPGGFYVDQAEKLSPEQHPQYLQPWLERAMTKAAPDEPILLIIGEMLMDSEPELARQYLEKAIAARQKPGNAHLLLSLLDNKQNRRRESQKHIKEAERIASQTHDQELVERVMMTQVLLDGPGAFLKKMMNVENPELLEDILSSMEDLFGYE